MVGATLHDRSDELTCRLAIVACHPIRFSGAQGGKGDPGRVGESVAMRNGQLRFYRCRLWLLQVVPQYSGADLGADIANAMSAPWAPSASVCSAGSPVYDEQGVQDILRPGSRQLIYCIVLLMYMNATPATIFSPFFVGLIP